jgi:hypothetical protein
VQKSPAVLKCKNQTLTTNAKIQNLVYRVEKQQLVSVYSKSGQGGKKWQRLKNCCHQKQTFCKAKL